MSVDFAGRQWRGSPNFGPRRDGLSPEIILLHYTGMSRAWRRRTGCASAKRGVGALHRARGRSIVQMVREVQRAWHAGGGWWRGRGDVNSRSIGIEIVNEGHEGGLPPFPDRQIEAVIALCAASRRATGSKTELVLAHSDVARAARSIRANAFPGRLPGPPPRPV
jgi:N-acetylmuramoyl-L-alanine amidase